MDKLLTCKRAMIYLSLVGVRIGEIVGTEHGWLHMMVEGPRVNSRKKDMYVRLDAIVGYEILEA